MGSEKTVPSSWRCFLASAVASASLIMPPERSLAASRGAAKRMETLMQEIRVFGHLPNWTKEAPLALRLKRAKDAEELTASQLAELEAMPASSKRVTGACATEILMTEIRAFGSPKRQHVDRRERTGRAFVSFRAEETAQCLTAC